MCKDWSERCSGKRVKAPEDRQDFEFMEKSAKDIEMDDLMASLQGMGGMGGMGKYFSLMKNIFKTWCLTAGTAGVSRHFFSAPVV